MTETFRPVPGPFGGTDEQKTQDAFVRFVGGTAKADELSLLSRLYPNDAGFRNAARQRRFTDQQIDAFLSL